MLADSIAVLDFETTGLSPAQQARATEIGVVIVEGGQIVARSLLLARRLLPRPPSHKLGNLNRWIGLPDTGQAHRALADAEMAANLTCFMAALLRERHGLAEVSHGLLCSLQKVPAAKMALTLQKHRERLSV